MTFLHPCRASWKIPAELEPCLESVRVVRDGPRFDDPRTVSPPIYPNSTEWGHLDLETAPADPYRYGDTRYTSILATFDNGPEGQVKILSPEATLDAISCAKQKMDINNLKINQVGLC